MKAVHSLVKVFHQLKAGRNMERMVKAVHPLAAGENTERIMLCHYTKSRAVGACTDHDLRISNSTQNSTFLQPTGGMLNTICHPRIPNDSPNLNFESSALSCELQGCAA